MKLGIWVTSVFGRVTSPFSAQLIIIRILLKTGLRWTHFQRKGILTKNNLKLRLKFTGKVCLVNMQCTTMKYEIITEPMLLEKVEVNILKSAHYY